MANQLFLLLWLLPSLMIGLPGVFSSPTIAFHRVQYDRPEKKRDHRFNPPRRNDFSHLPALLDNCSFDFTGPDSDSDVPRISVYECLTYQDDRSLNIQLDYCKGTVLIIVEQSGDKANLTCHNRGSYSPRYMVELPASLYDVARFGPSILKDERMFTTVISSSILGGNNETPGVAIKFMMETGGEALLQIGGVEPNRGKAIRIENLIFEPRRADRDRTTLAFIYPNGEIDFSHSLLNGDGGEFKWQPRFAMFFSNDDPNDGFVIEGKNYQCKPRYPPVYPPTSDFTLNEDLVSMMKQHVPASRVMEQRVSSSSSSASEVENDQQQKSGRKRLKKRSRKSSNFGFQETHEISYLF